VNFHDTFVDLDHINLSFPDYRVVVEVGGNKAVEEELKHQPYPAVTLDLDDKKGVVTVVPTKRLNPGPYPQDQPPRNTVRYTPVQVGGSGSRNDGDDDAIALLHFFLFVVLALPT